MFRHACFIVNLIILRPEFIRPFAINNDPNYTRWPNGIVPFVFNTLTADYSTTEQVMILAAMAQITSDMSGCVRFSHLGTTGIKFRNQNFVMISRSGASGTPSPTCYTYPGRIVSQNGVVQHMSIQASCLGSVRQVMRLLVSLLGLRPEFKKPNRDTFISVNTAAATAASVDAGTFDVLPTTAVLYNATEFDFHSITMLDSSTYSATGVPVLTPKSTTAIINNIGRLSYRDCQALSLIYGCNITCADVYGSLTSPLSTTGTVTALCNPDIVIEAAWTNYATRKHYFVSGSLVYVVQNGQVIENGTPLTNFTGAKPALSLPLIAGYYRTGLTNSVVLVDQSRNSFKFMNGVFATFTTGSGPSTMTAAAGFGNTAATLNPVVPGLVGTLYVDSSNAIYWTDPDGVLNSSTSGKALRALFSTNAVLDADLAGNIIQEIYSVIDTSGAEKVAFLYQPSDRPLQYFDAVPCSSTSMLDTAGQVCLTLAATPRNFASTIPACNALPFGNG